MENTGYEEKISDIFQRLKNLCLFWQHVYIGFIFFITYKFLIMNAVPSKKRKRRLKKSVKRTLLALFFSLILLAGLFFIISKTRPQKPKDVGIVRVDNFRDLNAIHLKHAKKSGIRPFESDREAKEKVADLVKDGKLALLKDSKFYKVDHLSHSHPYLTPETIELLNLIGERFHEKLESRNMEKYQYRITSVLRTRESQKRLRKSNGNATHTETAHLYGTTIDIGYKNLYKKGFWGKSQHVVHGPAIRLLSETIGELRKQGHLVVVKEDKQACFHITLANI